MTTPTSGHPAERAAAERPAGEPVPAQALPAPSGGWDLLVIGGGTAGIVGAKTAAGFGASVLLVERERPGGDCLWTGCVPSKALLSIAADAARARRGPARGIRVDGVRVDFPAVMAAVRAAIADIEPADSPQALTDAGVVVVRGHARFTGPRQAEVDGHPVPFRRALLATGAAPAVPPIPGLAAAVADGCALTSDTIWDLAGLPERLVVLGGGSIGCELGQAFARLGSRVTIVEAEPRLLPREDPDASAALTAALRADGVRVLTGAAVRQVRAGDHAVGGGVLFLAGHEGGHEGVAFDRLLVATGRVPRTRELGLDLGEVRRDRRGFVIVDAALRTSNRRIWAAGDLTGHPQFTHTAGVHASTAATNAVLGLRRAAAVAAIPRVTFTDPEIAAVGAAGPAPGGAASDGRPIGGKVLTRPHHEVDRARADARPEGFSRLVLDGRGRVIGATLVGPRAGESLAELVLAVTLRLPARRLAAAVPAYPTYADGPWNAAIADVRARLAAPPAARVIRALAALRRRLPDRTG